MISILVIFMFGSLVLAGSFESDPNIWYSPLTAAVIALPLFLCYARILSLVPGSNLFDIAVTLFGKFFGKAVVLLYTLYAIFLGEIVTRTFSEFIRIVAMPETPQIVIQSFLILLSVYLAKSGVENIGRISRFVLPIILAIIIFSVIIASTSVNFENLLPAFNADLSTIFKVSVFKTTFPLGEIILIASMFSSTEPWKKTSKIFIIALLIEVATLLTVSMRNSLVLGSPSISMYYFPSYEAVSISALGEIFTRTELLVGINYTLAGTIKMGICVYIASMGISKISNYEDMRAFVAPSALIMLFLAVVAAENAAEFFNLTNYYPYIALLFQLILPLIMLIAAEIKVRLNKPAEAAPQGTNNQGTGS